MNLLSSFKICFAKKSNFGTLFSYFSDSRHSKCVLGPGDVCAFFLCPIFYRCVYHIENIPQNYLWCSITVVRRFSLKHDALIASLKAMFVCRVFRRCFVKFIHCRISSGFLPNSTFPPISLVNRYSGHPAGTLYIAVFNCASPSGTSTFVWRRLWFVPTFQLEMLWVWRGLKLSVAPLSDGRGM